MELQRTSPNTAGPEAWPDVTSPINVELYTDVEIQVIGTPSVAYTPQRSLDGINFVNCNAYDKDGTIVTTITTAGIFSLEGSGHLKLTGGSGSTFIIRAGI